MHFWSSQLFPSIQKSALTEICQTNFEVIIRTLSTTTKIFNSPIDWRNAGHVVLRTDPFRQQSISNLPRKHCRILTFIVGDCIDDWWRCYLRLAAAYNPGLKAPRFIISGEKKGCKGEKNFLSRSNEKSFRGFWGWIYNPIITFVCGRIPSIKTSAGSEKINEAHLVDYFHTLPLQPTLPLEGF